MRLNKVQNPSEVCEQNYTTKDVNTLFMLCKSLWTLVSVVSIRRRMNVKSGMKAEEVKSFLQQSFSYHRCHISVVLHKILLFT